MTFAFDDTTGGSFIHYRPEVVRKAEIEFNEDLILYKAQIYDSNKDQKHERRIVAIDFEDAYSIAKVYFEAGCVSVIGIWEVDIVIGRYYE